VTLSDRTRASVIGKVVGIGDLAVVQGASGMVTTHALGSCIGVTVYDPIAHVGGVLHYMLPQPGSSDPVPANKLATYATTGLPMLFQQAYETRLQEGAHDRLCGGCRQSVG